MAPRAKATPKPLGDGQRQADAMYIMDSIMELASPIIINVSDIAARTGGKTNTIAKRFSVMRQRYPSLNIVTTIKSNESVLTAPAATAPATPFLSTRKKNVPVKGKPAIKNVVSKPTSRKTRQSTPAEIEEQSEEESANGEESGDEDQSEDEAPKVQTANNKRKRSSVNNSASARVAKKAKTAQVSNDEGSGNESLSEGQTGDEKMTAAIKGQQPEFKAGSEPESAHEGTKSSVTSEIIPVMLSPPEPLFTNLESNAEALSKSAQASVPDAEHESEPATIPHPSDKPSSPTLPTVPDVKLNDQVIASVPITVPSVVSPSTLPPRSQSPSATSLPPLQLLPAISLPDHDLKLQTQPEIETNTISPHQKKYDTLPPPLPSKKDKILTFAGIPLMTALLSDDTQKMIQDGELRSGVEMKIESISAGDIGESEREDVNGLKDTMRFYEWEM